MRIAFLLLLACSLCLHSQAPVQAQPEPSLVCLVPRVELGSVAKGRKVTHAFKLENRSRAPLNIHEVNASCDCTTAPLPIKVLAPGATVELPVTFDSTKFEGRVEKSIVVTSDDPVRPALVLDLVATVVDAWTITPGGVYFGHHSRFTPFEARVRLERKDGREPVVRGAAVRNAPLIDEPEILRLPQQKAVEVILRIAPGAPEGLVKGKLALVLDDPEQPSRELAIQGQLVNEIEASPRALDLGAVAQGALAAVPLRLTTFRTGLEIKEIAVEPAWITAQLAPRKALEASSIRAHKVQFQVAQEAPLGPFQARVRVRTNSPYQPELTVEIRGTITAR